MQKYTITSADCKSEMRVFSGNCEEIREKKAAGPEPRAACASGRVVYGLATRVKVITVASSVRTSWSPFSSICS